MLAALAAIAALTIGGFAWVLVSDRTPPPAPAPSPARSAGTEAPLAAPAPARPAVPLAPPAAPAAAPPPPPELVPFTAGLVRQLEPMRQEVFAGLADLEGRIRACGLRDAQLALFLETQEGAVKVLRVRVLGLPTGSEVADTASLPERDDPAAACTRGALEGQVLASPSARPGRRWEMPWMPGTRP
jgi:hypothetical protein